MWINFHFKKLMHIICKLPADYLHKRYKYTHNPLTCIGVRTHTHTQRLYAWKHAYYCKCFGFNNFYLGTLLKKSAKVQLFNRILITKFCQTYSDYKKWVSSLCLTQNLWNTEFERITHVFSHSPEQKFLFYLPVQLRSLEYLKFW